MYSTASLFGTPLKYKAHNPKRTISSVILGGGNVMIWICTADSGNRPLFLNIAVPLTEGAEYYNY